MLHHYLKKNKLSLKVVNEITDFNHMFSCSESLTSLDVSNWDVSNGKNFWGMFDSCENLTSLDISNWDVRSVTDMTMMFDGSQVCDNIPCWYNP